MRVSIRSAALVGQVCFRTDFNRWFSHFVSSLTSLVCLSHATNKLCKPVECIKPVSGTTVTTYYLCWGRLFSRRQYRAISGMASDGIQDKISFQDYDAFGFDLDHTIAKYKLVALFDLVYECVTTFLVNKKGYDPRIKDDLHKYKDFICKGLFLDIKKGNILKLAHDGTILRATHGTHLLTKAQVEEVYGGHREWEHAKAVKRTLRNGHSDFRFFENYFDCPGLVATARIIDLIDQQSLSKEEKEKQYIKGWDDVLQSLLHMYHPSGFSAEKGGYFAKVKSDASQFVEACSADIRRWMESLKQAGKIVFLLTNSNIDYSSCLLQVCLGKDWQSYFDISLFNGHKPAFFTDDTPFHIIEQEKEAAAVTELQRDGHYSQGNVHTFSKFLARELGKDTVKVVYFGDNICSDCFPSKHFAQWDTVLILEEMDAEGYICSDDTVPAANQPNSKRNRVLQHSSLVTAEEMDYLISDFWGPFLLDKDSGSSSRTPTFWGDIIVQYSDIAVPSLEYLAGVPLDHKFERFTRNGSDTTGYHPGRPSSLLS